MRAGADLVVGSGPHVLRGMEWYRGRLIAYSLGNFVGYHALATDGRDRRDRDPPGHARQGLVLGGRRPRSRDDRGRGIPRPDPDEAAHGIVRTLSKQDFGKRAMSVSRTGVLRPPR